MQAGARRLLSLRRARPARRALLAMCLWHAGIAASAAQDVPAASAAQTVPVAGDGTIAGARYEAPTGRYAHGVLGDAIEFGALVLALEDGRQRTFTLPETLVFEDTAPRLADLDGDGAPEVLVVESHQNRGARLAVWGAEGRISATPYIGTRFRWLAPLGAADLDADGRVEIAYVDRPHLAKTLRIWRYAEGTLTEVAMFEGVTNHRIGEEDIAGGIRDCGAGSEMIVANEAWSALQALAFAEGRITARRIGTDTTRAGFARAMRCAD